MINRYGRYSPQAWRTWHARRFHRLSCVVPPPMYSSSPIEKTMENRYGRHGSRAWKNWHERRFHRSCSDNNSYDVIVHVELSPVQAERVIFIMSEFDDWDSTSRSIPQDGDQKKIANQAISKASEDVGILYSLFNKRTFLVINPDGLRHRSASSGRSAILEIFAGRTPSTSELQRLILDYQDAYHRRFEEELQYLEGIELYTEQQIRLHTIAVQDRKNEPDSRQYHIRDLAVLRVLADMDMSAIDGQEHLSTIHELADFYQSCYANPREAVSWPSDGPFRST